MNTLLNEFSVDHSYMMLPSAYAAFRSQIINCMETGKESAFDAEKRLTAIVKFVDGQMNESGARLTNFHAYEDEDFGNDISSQSDVKYINILNVTGMITRGDGYSYGSLAMRDLLMRAAYRDDVIAHVLYCRTPGGAGSALNDFDKAFEYIRSRGQKVFMFCDGPVASLGAVIASRCDGVYAFNAEDEIGSIGLYKACLVLPSGSVNAVTKEKYVEVYAEKSSEKNREVRAAGNDEIEFLTKMANEELEEVLTRMRVDRPSIREDQMNGAMFKMKDVVGSMIDGICTLPKLCEKIYSDWSALQSSINRGSSAEGTGNQMNTNPNNNKTMSKEYKHIDRACYGVENEIAMASNHEGVLTLQTSEADALEAHLQSISESNATLSEENTSLKMQADALCTSLANMTLERDAALRQVTELKEAAEKNDDTLASEVRSEMQAQIDEAASRYAALEDSKKELENSFAELATIHNNLEAKATADAEAYAHNLAAKEQIISDLQAQLAEAQSGIGAKVVAGESPKSNGEAPGASQMTSAPAWDPTKTPAENVKIFNDYMASQKNRVK